MKPDYRDLLLTNGSAVARDAIFPRLESFARLIMQLVPPGSHILEIGPGEAQLARTLSSAGYRLSAVDREQRSSFPTEISDFEAFDPKGAQYHCVAASLVLHHMSDLEGCVRKMQRMLKPAGLVAIDDYGWERLDGAAARREWGAAWKKDLENWKRERSLLQRSDKMLATLDRYFERVLYREHAYFRDGIGEDTLAFTYIGQPRQKTMYMPSTREANNEMEM